MSAMTVEPGQSWAILDRRYEGWRYVTVEQIDHGKALVRPRGSGGRRSRIRLESFRKFSFCGHNGAGVLPPYAGSVANACANCPPKQRVLPLDRNLTPGFGLVMVTRDDKHVWAALEDTDMTVAGIEEMAQAEPGDWRIEIHGPMSEELYQRQDDGWVLVWRGFGFA